MRWVLLFVLPSAVFGLFAVALPRVGPEPRWRVVLKDKCPRVSRRRRDARCDPFEVLRLQTRLGAVARQVRDLTTDSGAYARAHRLEAALAAYDDLLEEACRVAGVALEPPPSHAGHEFARGQQRLHEEMELSARCWSW